MDNVIIFRNTMNKKLLINTGIVYRFHKGYIQYINCQLSIASSISIIVRRLQFIVALCVCVATNYIYLTNYSLNLSYFQHRMTSYVYIHIHTLLKVLPWVCTENTPWGCVLRDKYSTRRSQVLYLFRDTPLSALFSIHTSKATL